MNGNALSVFAAAFWGLLLQVTGVTCVMSITLHGFISCGGERSTSGKDHNKHGRPDSGTY